MRLHLLTAALLPLLALADLVPSNGCKSADSFPASPGGEPRGVALGNRKAWITLPKNYVRGAPAPLIVALHESNMTALEFARVSLLSDGRYNEDAVVLYPEAVDLVWITDPQVKHPAKDREFIGKLLDLATSSLCIDTDRIYAAGLGSGAGLADTLACLPEFASRIAAFALVNSATYHGPLNKAAIKDEFTMQWTTCKPERVPMRLLEIHGANNTVYDFFAKGRAKNHGRKSVVEWIVDWAVRNECGAALGRPEKMEDSEMSRTKLQMGTLFEGAVHPGRLQKAYYRCYQRTQDELADEVINSFRVLKAEDIVRESEEMEEREGRRAVGAVDPEERKKSWERGEVALVQWYVYNHGHGWPRAVLGEGRTRQLEPEEGVPETEEPVFDSTKEVLEFFRKFRLSDEHRVPGANKEPDFDEEHIQKIVDRIGQQVESATKEVRDRQEAEKGENVTEEIDAGREEGEKGSEDRTEAASSSVRDEL